MVGSPKFPDKLLLELGKFFLNDASNIIGRETPGII